MVDKKNIFCYPTYIKLKILHYEKIILIRAVSIERTGH